jgi:DNA modification methylase
VSLPVNQIICGDCLKVLPSLPPARMIFADPPDNLGLTYDGFKDKWGCDEDYVEWLTKVARIAIGAQPSLFWLSYYWKWDWDLKGKIWTYGFARAYEKKPYVWWYTFGQHNHNDNGSCFRPLLRFKQKGADIYPDAIREQSQRQRNGDTRADPRGRVPGDVWNEVWQESRVCGTFQERRTWHPTQHPEALIERMVRMSTNSGDLVVDLFAGTGTVNRVCQRLGRGCIGIDISETYCRKIAEETGAELVFPEGMPPRPTEQPSLFEETP